MGYRSDIIHFLSSKRIILAGNYPTDVSGSAPDNIMSSAYRIRLVHRETIL